MSKTEWTPAQKTAIEHRGGSMLVSAAAGSGKTAVLVERVSLLLTDPVSHIDADKLLIVTFTNAAAAELRGRIAKSIESMIRETPRSDGKRLELLRRQKVRLQRASICTMDAFCLSLLQKNFASLDIPPDFATADPAQLARLREEVLAQVMEESCHDADFCRFSDLYGRSRDDRKAGDLILKLYDFLRSLPQPWKTLEEFCRAWELGYPMRIPHGAASWPPLRCKRQTRRSPWQPEPNGWHSKAKTGRKNMFRRCRGMNWPSAG